MQRAAHQEFHRKIIDAAALLRVAEMTGLDEFIHDLVANGQRHGLIDLLLGRLVQRAAEAALQIAGDRVLDPVNIIYSLHALNSLHNNIKNRIQLILASAFRSILAHSIVRYKKK